MAARSARACAQCGVTKDLKKCSACNLVWYCSREHQREHRPAHRTLCKSVSTSSAPTPAPAPAPAPAPRPAGAAQPEIFQVPAGGMTPESMRAAAATGWTAGKSAAQQHEWLVDCYRMRVDDDHGWGGGVLRGLYKPNDTSTSVVIDDFLVFCKLAARRRVVPAGWNWGAFLTCACGLLGYAFEKADAQDKYGSENFFSAMMGGASLRATAGEVYGCGLTHGEKDESGQYAAVTKIVRQLSKGLRDPRDVYKDVGGCEVWGRLESTFSRP